MGTNTTSRGYRYPDGAAVPALDVLLGQLAGDINTDANALSVKDYQAVASVAARTARLAALAAQTPPVVPSTATPILFFRADATAGREFEYTTDGATFRALSTLVINGAKTTATTDASGNLSFAHGLGAAPKTVNLTLAGGNTAAVNQVGKLVVVSFDATNVAVNVVRSDTGAALVSTPVNFYWQAFA